MLAALVVSAGAQSFPWQRGSGETDAPAVRYEYPEQVTVAAGRSATVELHFRIREGLHINSHTPLQKSLIRTELIVMEPPGVKVAAVDFPAGSDYALKALPNEKLSVYTGEVVLQAHVNVQRGEHLVQAALRYQACDANSCYPPKKAPVAVDIIAR
jgi:hypothetical protein